MHVAALRLELRVPAAQSLKEKRHVVKTLVATLAQKHGVAVSEVDHQNLWQRASLGVAAVSPQAGQLERILHSVRRTVETSQAVELLSWHTTHLEDPE